MEMSQEDVDEDRHEVEDDLLDEVFALDKLAGTTTYIIVIIISI